MIAECLSFAGFSLIVLFLAWMISTLKNGNGARKKQAGRINVSLSQKGTKIAFLHPNCWDGGGGERTLWAAVVALKKKCPNWKVSILCNSLPTDAKIKRVQLALPSFDFARTGTGSFIVALEVAIRARDASLIVDTIGYPFVYPLFKGVFGFKVLAYVHYPFINYDVLKKPSFKHSYNSFLLTAYSLVGSFVDCALCNSSWTFNHIKGLWKGCRQRSILYPPCDLSPFLTLERPEPAESEFVILSLSQFRPEKNHRLQLEIAKLISTHLAPAKFVFIGGCRNERDHQRVEELKSYASELGISQSTQFLINLPFPSLMMQLSVAHVGLHTMFEEHFGIGIVELMAGGLITIAHNSGGPRADIIRPGKNGYLASSAQEYAEIILKIAKMSSKDRQNMANYARSDVKKRFSGELFEESIVRSIKHLI